MASQLQPYDNDSLLWQTKDGLAGMANCGTDRDFSVITGKDNRACLEVMRIAVEERYIRGVLPSVIAGCIGGIADYRGSKTRELTGWRHARKFRDTWCR